MSISKNNRRLALESIIEKLPQKRKDVYQVILKKGFCSREQIAEELNLSDHSVSGRITELKNEHFVIREIGSTKSNKTKCSITLYSICTPEEVEEYSKRNYNSLAEDRNKLDQDIDHNLSRIGEMLIKKAIKTIDLKMKRIALLFPELVSPTSI